MPRTMILYAEVFTLLRNVSKPPDCGLLLESLCPEAEGCVQDADGGVTMPESLGGMSGDGYRMRTTQVGGLDKVLCSEDFNLMASEDAPVVGEVGGGDDGCSGAVSDFWRGIHSRGERQADGSLRVRLKVT